MSIRSLTPFLFTYAAMVAGVSSLLAAAAGSLVLSAKLIMLSMILDGLDGHVARLLKRTSDFGAELDTFVDVVSFGVAPAFLAWQAALHEFGALGVLVVCLIVSSGASRLARFRLVNPDRGQKGYTGLPITVLAGWLAMAVLIVESGLLSTDWVSLTEGPVATLAWTVAVMFTFLQISEVHYGKPTKAPVIFAVCGLAVAFLFLTQELAVASAIGICAGMFFYGVFSPYIPRQEELIEMEMDMEEADDEEPLPVHHS